MGSLLKETQTDQAFTKEQLRHTIDRKKLAACCSKEEKELQTAEKLIVHTSVT